MHSSASSIPPPPPPPPPHTHTHFHTGVELLKSFQALYSEHEQQRQELTNAEKLFDLPITMVPDLMEVDKELKALAKVYELYEAQRVSLVIEGGALYAGYTS